MQIDQLKEGVIIRGAAFPEPVQIISFGQVGHEFKLIGEGLTSGKVYKPILNGEQLALLAASPDKEPYDGDAIRFRLGIESMRLALAYEYDPYFSLSIARVDLPQQPHFVLEEQSSRWTP